PGRPRQCGNPHVSYAQCAGKVSIAVLRSPARDRRKKMWLRSKKSGAESRAYTRAINRRHQGGRAMPTMSNPHMGTVRSCGKSATADGTICRPAGVGARIRLAWLELPLARLADEEVAEDADALRILRSEEHTSELQSRENLVC